MSKITPESIAELKALFQDNEKALGSNFSQLIDFFNDNKVTDNGDGTFTVGAITVDASKLYDLINNSSPNILPLDNEFTGKNTFDIAPINKANGKPYITEDSVPPVDLSNYPTKDQLATKADTSAIDPSVMFKKTLTANDDVLTLSDGMYQVWGPVPKNLPNIGYGSGSDWGYITVKSVNSGTRWVTYSNTSGKSEINILRGDPANWSGWQVLNSDIMASKTDVTTAVNTATANMADSSKPTNFTAGLQSGGVDVATAADLKSVADKAWYQLDNKYITCIDGTLSPWTNILYKIDQTVKRMYLVGYVITSEPTSLKVNLSNIIKSAPNTDNLIGYYKSGYLYSAELYNDRTFTISTGSSLYTFIGIGSSKLESAYFEYTELV